MKHLKVATVFFLIFAGFSMFGCGGGGGGGGDGDGGGGYSWPLLLENSGLPAELPQIAGDDAGNYMVVWRQEFAGAFNIYARRYSSGGVWGSTERLDTPTIDSNNPQVAVDGTGNFAVVWQQDDADGTIQAVRYTSGGGWGSVERLDDDALPSVNPQVAGDGSGNFMVVWEEFSGFDVDILAKRFNDVGLAEVISTGDSFNPQVAADGAGNFMAVWEEDDGANSIFTNYFDSVADSWQGAEAREALGDDAFNPQVAGDSSGDFVIVWEQVTGAVHSIFNAYYDDSGAGWGAAALLEALPLMSGDPQVAGDDAGNFAAVWVYDDGAFDSIRGSNYEAGSWSAVRLLEGLTDDASIPQVAANASGDFMAVWAHDDGGSDDILASKYNAGAGVWGFPQTVDAGSFDANAPQVAGGANNFLAVWSQGDGVNESIFANRLF